MPTDAFEMALVHRVFRDELRSAPELIGSVQPGQRERLKLVADHITNVLGMLHHHHMAEDELLWPKLHARIPQCTDDIQRMEAEHELIAKWAHSVELSLAAWIAAPRLTPGQLENWSESTHTLVSDLNELARLVDAHLDAEESEVVPLINANVSDDEWRATTERGASFLNRSNIRFGLAVIGMIIEGCSDDQRRRFFAGMPRPQRLLVRLFGRHAASRYRARLESA